MCEHMLTSDVAIFVLHEPVEGVLVMSFMPAVEVHGHDPV